MLWKMIRGATMLGHAEATGVSVCSVEVATPATHACTMRSGPD